MLGHCLLPCVARLARHLRGPVIAIHTSASANSADEQIIGGYTPITKKLWQDRAQLGHDTPLAAAGARPSKQTTVVYNFATDKALRENYCNPWGYMRVGRLLEDLDSMAGNVAFDHCYQVKEKPPLLVTASVEEIHIKHPLNINRDIKVKGQVVWTGKSSLDIQMRLFQEQYPESEPSLEALFSFVHLDPVTRRAAPLPQLQPGTEREQQIFKQRQHVADERRAARHAQATAGHVEVPAPALQWMTEQLSAARRMQELPGLAPTDAVLMSNTCLQNTFICQPQQRNMHGRVFGGFLMRRAYELAFATTYMFAGMRPAFIRVDEITFSKPVDVGDLLRLKSQVVHSHKASERKGHLVVEVEARVTKPEIVDSYVTNTFRFLYSVEAPEGASPLRFRRVLPSSEEEARKAWSAKHEEV